MLFFAPICALVHTVALRALVLNKNPSFLHRGCVFQASENGPHCGHVDSAERPEFLPGEKKLNSWGGKGSQYNPPQPPNTHTQAVSQRGQSYGDCRPQKTPRHCTCSPNVPQDLCHCSIHNKRTKHCLSVCLL